MLSRLRSTLRIQLNSTRNYVFQQIGLPILTYHAQKRLNSLITRRGPRFLVVKQDVQSDLYCVPPGSNARDIVFSTLMRTGPVALFTTFKADFKVVETVNDPECCVWKQPALECGWTPLEDMLALRKNIPGRKYGQAEFAVPIDDISWNDYDVIISIDVSIPERITRQFPNVTWCYYIREPKTSAYSKSHLAALTGQDIFLNQCFRPRHLRPYLASHEVEFPYYLQYPGCFDGLLEEPAIPTPQRSGIFLEHHTPELLSLDQINCLKGFGPVSTTACLSTTSPNGYEGGSHKSKMSAEQIIRALRTCKYFIKLGGRRNVWGNAYVEAFSTGCLALGDPNKHTHGSIFSSLTTVSTFDQLVARIKDFEANPSRYNKELRLQRQIVNYLCFIRPMLDLMNKLSVLSNNKKSGGVRITNAFS